MTNTRFEYSSDKQITTSKIDETDNFLWVAFAQNSDGNCIIEKEFFAQPKQTFFSLEREVNEVKAIDLDTDNIYVAYDDDTLIGEIIDKDNPLTVTTEISLPIGINEKPVDIAIDGSILWFLLPGNTSGENAKLIRYNSSGVFQETIDLVKTGLTILNAVSMAVDSNGDLRIVTNEDPVRLVRVFQISGGIYDFSSTSIE